MNSLLIAANIVKRVFKSPMTVAAMIVLPLILIFIMLAAIKGLPASKPKAGVADLDGGTLAVKVVEFIRSQNFDVIKATDSDCANLVRDKKAKFSVVIPEGFSQDIAEGRRSALDFFMNENDSEAEGIGRSLNQFLSGDRQVVKAKIPAENNAANPSVGFAVTFMAIFIFTTIGIILDDKKKLTLARMFVSPIKEWEIILGNLLGSLALGVLQIIPLVAALKISYGIVSLYELAGLFVILFCFLVAIIGIGIGISGLIKNAFNPATLIAAVIMPAGILGGCFIPDSMLPDFMNRIGYVVPQKWVMDAIQSVLAGGSFGGIALNLAIILLFGVAFATFGLKTLRPLSE